NEQAEKNIGAMYVANTKTDQISQWLPTTPLTAPPSEPESPTSPGLAVSTVRYGLPVGGAGAPYGMEKQQVQAWGQEDVPVEAAAVFPPSEIPAAPASSYKQATVYYLDEHGRTVNVAVPGKSPSGSIATTEYNALNDAVRTLSPDNRAAALAAGSSSVEMS